MDYTKIDGGLARMLDRLHEEGTATEVPEADELLRENGNAILLGLLYDQRVRAEMAFTGPYKLKQRLGHLDMNKIASMDFDDFQEKFAEKPAVHRFTNSMAERTQKVAGVIADEYDGDAAAIWAEDVDLATIKKRIKDLPGFGPSKTKKIGYCLHYFGHRTFNAGDE